jgi:hypothetical protein
MTKPSDVALEIAATVVVERTLWLRLSYEEVDSV